LGEGLVTHWLRKNVTSQISGYVYTHQGEDGLRTGYAET